jgi:hypothetical protein
VAIFTLLKKHSRSDGDQCCLKDNRKPLREFGTPLEVSHDHFLVTPPSHCTLQKVKGLAVGLIGDGRESMTVILDQIGVLSIEI